MVDGFRMDDLIMDTNFTFVYAVLRVEHPEQDLRMDPQVPSQQPIQ
jgi:hypothetical protein